MRKQRALWQWMALLAFGATFVLAGAKGGSGGCGGPAVCEYNGKTYTEGQSFPSTDGCNTCSCSGDGLVACTLRACVKTCTYDGKTYQEGDSFPATDGCNTCTCSNGDVACTEKACQPQACGSRGLKPCPTGSYCDQPKHCGATDIPGECKPKPQACDQVYDPVCGCDNKTYGNACMAASAGVSVKTSGACKSQPKTCTYNGKTYNEGDSFPASDGCNTCTCSNGSVGCTEKACGKVCGGLGGGTCAKNEWCDQTGHCGYDDGTGVCKPKPQTCTRQYDPVCGCDGKTYSNACMAQAVGTAVYKKGKCESKPTTCLYDGKTYKHGESFPATDGCNTCTCSNGSVACTEKACGKVCGGFGGVTCAKNEWCDQTGHCGYADGTGICKPRPQACPEHIDWVCGCDGKTYSNECHAQAAGTAVYKKGKCESKPTTCLYDGKTYKDGETFPSSDGCNTCSCSGGRVACTKKACAQPCGSRGLKPCPSGSYCEQPKHCGATDIPGVCKPKPQNCTQQYDPVCGCDGKTYGNACTASAAGVSVQSKGTCN